MAEEMLKRVGFHTGFIIILPKCPGASSREPE